MSYSQPQPPPRHAQRPSQRTQRPPDQSQRAFTQASISTSSTAPSYRSQPQGSIPMPMPTRVVHAPTRQASQQHQAQQQHQQQQQQQQMPPSSRYQQPPLQTSQHPSPRSAYSGSERSLPYAAPAAEHPLHNPNALPERRQDAYRQQEQPYSAPRMYAPPPPPAPSGFLGGPLQFAGHPPMPMGNGPDPFTRKRTVRKIPLTPQGNLVLDIPVSERVLNNGKFRDEEEFTHMRYTAVVCAADDFSSKGYSLRQQDYGRSTELFIVMTMYNENDELFCKSMNAVMKNIAHLCTRSRSKVWGNEGWKKVVVCIVSDGRTKVNRRVLDVLGLMGVYQDGVMKDHVNEKPVTAHLFEYTTQVAVDAHLTMKGYEKGYVPVQILFCLKEKNAKKINSHRWFFNAFGPLLRPNICMLLDVGTKPQETALYHLWKAFDRNPSVGGACGEIYAELGTGCSNLLNPIVAAQNFEYKMSNILDKPLESVCGYISVLPGAFSAYRYVALQGKPLMQYFKGETMHGGASVSTANMYLAEDRILCFELVTKREQAWLLKYVKSAKAETDVPDSVPEFISQRRRWLNGSFFAGVHALQHWYHIFRSGHNPARKMILLVEFIYNAIMTLFNWFGLSFFYLTFFFLANTNTMASSTDGTPNPPPDPALSPFGASSQGIFEVLRPIYIAAVVTCFISAMGNRPQGSRWIYIGCMILFAAIMGIMLFYCGWDVYQSLPKKDEWDSIHSVSQLIKQRPALKDIVLSLASTYGLYIIASCLYFEPWHMITSFVQYLFLMPSFMNILMIYAFSNLHDVSWGTKGDNSNASDLGAVTSSKAKDGTHMVSVEVPTERTDINASYDKFLANLREPRTKEKQKRDVKTKQEDSFKQYRTNLLLSWMFSNALVIIILTNEKMQKILYTSFGKSGTNGQDDGQFNPFLRFTFYSVMAISAFRFIGCVLYLVTRATCG
ncbi:Chitin synthase, class 2 [Thoreauomyces humboldtii]|nr:Chitin synthase, class 2 [Thoreauomyces humboldtii]